MAFCRSGCFRCLPLPHDQVLQVRNSTLFLRCPELPCRQFPGPPAPELDFSAIPGKVDAYILLIEIHYRHYQFYANMLVATAIAYGCRRIDLGTLCHID